MRILKMNIIFLIGANACASQLKPFDYDPTGKKLCNIKQELIDLKSAFKSIVNSATIGKTFEQQLIQSLQKKIGLDRFQMDVIKAVVRKKTIPLYVKCTKTWNAFYDLMIVDIQTLRIHCNAKHVNPILKSMNEH